MNILTKSSVKPVMMAFLIFSISVFFSVSVQAIPPTPPMQLQLPKIEELAALQPEQPEKGVFTVLSRVRAHREVSKLTLIVRTNKAGTLGRPAGQLKNYVLKPMIKGQTQSIAIKIPAQEHDGIYRIAAALRIEQKGKAGVVSKKVFIQVVENGHPRLTTPAELRRTQVLKKKQAFQENLAKKQPDIRLLMDSTIPVPVERKKHIRLYSGPKQKLSRGSGPPVSMRPYIIDKTMDKNTSRKAPLVKPQSSSASLPLPSPPQVKGQVVFEDFYTNLSCNPYDVSDPYYPCDSELPPVLSPLANATILLFTDNTGGDDFNEGVTVTDENGFWSIDIDSSILGSNFYYTVSLGNESFDVRDDAGNDYIWRSATRFGGDGPFPNIINFGQETMTSNVEAAQVFTVMNLGWNHIVTEGGGDPDDLEYIEVRFPDFCIVDNSPTACWDTGAEIIRIQAEDNDGPDLILHEYGHALQYYAFGGNPVAGGAHSFDDIEQDLGVAFGEGWAAAFALSVCPDQTWSWSEGTYEGPDEWPTCAVNTDYGEWIEGFRSPTESANRLGEHHEGRVGAAINDFLDALNDNNDGTESRGKNGYEDANENDRISLATIFRDHMLGYNFNNFINFFIHLRSGLSSTKQSLGDDIMTYNWMSWPITVPVPDTLCVASKVAMAMSPEYATVLDGLRGFRDKVMKPLAVGRRWIQTYYSHSPEMAILMIGNSEARQGGQVVVEHFFRFGLTLKEPQGFERLSESQEAVLPPRVIASIKKISKVINAKGSEELKQKLAETLEFLKTFKGMSVSQAVRHVSAMKKAGRGKEMLAIQPMKLAPGSTNVDWALIKKNLPSEELPGKQ